MVITIWLIGLFTTSSAFECFTCNDGQHDDDTKPCRDMKSFCPPGVTSCSMLVYKKDRKTHMRKFCSAKNTPLYQYLQLLPGSSLCQNINGNEEETRWSRSVGPPASPTDSTSLLCVCSTPLCNKGSYKKVIENTMMNNLPKRRLPEIIEEPSPPNINEIEFPDDLLKQMNDAGF